jgi:hypothetical protein
MKTLEEAAENYGWKIKRNPFSDRVKANELADSAKQDFISGANWQAERMYSEEELRKAFHVGRLYQGREGDTNFDKWFEQFKKK